MTQILRQRIIKIFITIFTVAWGTISLLTPTLVHSQQNNQQNTHPDGNVCGIFGANQCATGLNNTNATGTTARGNTESFLLKIARNLMFFAAIACVIFIIIGGFIMLTSNAQADSLKKGRAYVINAIVGLIIILLAQLIVELIIGITKGAFNIDANGNPTK